MAGPTVQRGPSAESLNLTACDREPIHVPGAVMPHGLLLVADALSLKQSLNFFLRDLVAGFKAFLEHRILRHLRIDHVLQFQPIKLEDRDHLNQTRGKDLLLRNPQLQSGREQTHLGFILTEEIVFGTKIAQKLTVGIRYLSNGSIAAVSV